MDRPLLVYDGDCSFCRLWIARWKATIGDRITCEPYQSTADRFPEIPREDFKQAVHLIEPDGSVTRGAEAVFAALVHGSRAWPLALYRNLPGARPVCEAAYRFTARHRDGAYQVTRLLWGNHVVPPGESRTVALFLRALGVVFAIAFISLWVQVIGLVGENGILPAHEYFQAARDKLGPERFWYLPGVFWLGAGNTALHLVCGAGLLCSLLLVVGFVPGIALAGAWLGYLSLLGAGQTFLRFQWDSLLLEAGAVALLLVPWGVWLHARTPSRPALWLARWLIFRLMFTSAVVKLTSGDPAWRSFTALDYHYFTQPLPPWTAWYAQQAPEWFQKFSVGVMFLLEGVAPFLIFGPRRVRFLGAAAIVALQIMMMITGNFGFFNILSIVLCIPLLDDGVLGRVGEWRAPASPRRGRIVRAAIASLLFVMSFVHIAGAFRKNPGWLAPARDLVRVTSPFHLVNPYGLFAVMTRERPEIVIEGSRDGVEWRAYEFRYKPGDLSRRPRMMSPHMPRLDWQMWFASLGDVQRNRWFLIQCWRLLQGTPEVRELFALDPFGDEPPRYIRANVYMYTFTTPEERRETGAWWKRTLRGPYVRTLMLQDGVLTTAPESPAPDS